MNYKYACALILLTAFTIKSEGLCINSWSDSSSTWNTAGNWGGGCVPGQSGMTAQDSASFTNSAVGNTTITLNIDAGLNALQFDSTAASYSITGTDYLQFNGATSTIYGENGVHSIATPIHLNNTTLNIVVASPSGVFFSGQLTDLGTSSITVSNPGNFGIQGTVAGTTITINGDFSVTSNFLLSDVTGASTSTTISAVNLLMSSSATITNFNSSTITTDSFVANEWDLSGNISINGATLNNINQGPLTGVMHTSGNHVETMTGDFTLSQGAVVNSNSGNISGGDDVDGNQVIAVNMTLSSNGSFSNNNNGSVSSAVSGDGNYIDLSG
ncbi:MAG TPA: hypothetical protein VMR37_05655, partial [Rhabdochlamydiaceae bacterium]|nr:hypothetical protein [Rhabdochlamydiaceae bacterium]